MLTSHIKGIISRRILCVSDVATAIAAACAVSTILPIRNSATCPASLSSKHLIEVEAMGEEAGRRERGGGKEGISICFPTFDMVFVGQVEGQLVSLEC